MGVQSITYGITVLGGYSEPHGQQDAVFVDHAPEAKTGLGIVLELDD